MPPTILPHAVLQGCGFDRHDKGCVTWPFSPGSRLGYSRRPGELVIVQRETNATKGGKGRRSSSPPVDYQRSGYPDPSLRMSRFKGLPSLLGPGAGEGYFFPFAGVLGHSEATLPRA